MNRATAIFGAIALIASASANATLVVSGEYLEIDGRISEPVSITNGSRVVLNDGQIVAPGQGLPNTGVVTLAPASDGQRISFEMKGHSVLTSNVATPIFFNFLSTVRLMDNSLVVAPGAEAIVARGSNGGNRLHLEDHATVVGDIVVDANVYISDQARVVGTLREQLGNVRLFMSGGSILDGVRLSSAGDYVVEIGGGRIDNALTVWYSSNYFLEMSGGEINGGLNSFGWMNDGNIYGGSINGGLHLGSQTNLSIWDGTFNASSGGWLLDTLNVWIDESPRQIASIWGGQFGNVDAGNGIRLTGISGLDFYGYDLTLTNGLLTGFLSDGNRIEVPVVTDANWTGVINLHDVRKSVPEPSTAILMLTALFGLSIARRRGTASTERQHLR